MAGAGYKLFNTGDVLTAAQVNTYLMQQTVMVFASSTARTTALSGVLAEGMVSYLQDTNATEVYDGSAWVAIANTGDITSVGVTSPITGGGTSGAVTIAIQDASTTQKGAVQLTDSTSSTSTTTAATPNSVKSAYDLANGAIAKTLTTTTGDIIYASSANTPARLGIGSSGQVLTVSGGIPSWAAAASSGSLFLMTPTSTANTGGSISTSGGAVTASGCTSFSINGVFTSSYANYILVVEQILNSQGDSAVSLRLRASGTDTTTNYYDGLSYVLWSGGTSGSGSTDNGNKFQMAGCTTGHKTFANFTITSPQLAQNTGWGGISARHDGSGFVSGVLKNTTQYDGITIFSAAGNTSAVVRVYGLAN